MQAALLLLSLYAFEEFARAVGLWRERRYMWWARGMIALVYVPVFLHRYGIFMAMPAYVILLAFIIAVARDIYRGMIQRTCLTALGVLYFGWFLAHLGFLMNFRGGAAALLAVLMLVVLNDASAYLIGSTIGRHKLSPNVSPNKTIEGMLGAMAVTMAATFALRWALPPLPLPLVLLLGLLIGLGGTLGDLSISMIKRDVGIKDTGTLIPGHGGLLDRLDSVLFASPVFFHFLRYFAEMGQ
jgi:phosphatidate cytidylyltransferase